MKKLVTIISILLLSNPSYSNDLGYSFDYNLDDNVEIECNDLDDPFEKVNRKIFFFNSFLDHIALKPLAKAYSKLLNEPTKNRVGDFVDNIYEPLTTVNYGLQGNLDKTLSSFWKFTVNTIFGIAGTNDVASKFGLNHKPQTFGATLAHYGVSPGPYVVLPLLGSTNMRDMWDAIAFDDKLNPLKYHMSSQQKDIYSGVRLVHKRAEIMPFTDYISKNSTDPYAAIRSALHQRREAIVHYPEGYRCGKKINTILKKTR